jgi:hypothetical protein
VLFGVAKDIVYEAVEIFLLRHLEAHPMWAWRSKSEWVDRGRCSMKKSQGGKLEHGGMASRFVASSYEIQNSVVVVVVVVAVFTMT